MYVIPILYRLTSTANHMSIARLHHAFKAVITRHNTLRTALYLDTNGNIIQRCLDSNTFFDGMKSYGFSVVNLLNDDRHINEIINEILYKSDLFDLSKGCVIHFHILRHCCLENDMSPHNDDILTNNDLILISVHHAVFDRASISIFIRDLSLVYERNCSLSMDENTLQYIDYSVYERLMDMTPSHKFWHSQLKGYNLENSLSLLVDRHRSSTDQRSGFASITEISFDDDILKTFLEYTSSYQVTPFQLGLTTFYAFLFKLTHGQSDLCIAGFNTNRYKNELQNIIGMFVATLPYRIQLDPHWPFDELIEHVQEKRLSILEHSHYPLQHILTDSQLNLSNVSFLEAAFDFITVSLNINQLPSDEVRLEQISLDRSYEVSKFDFMITFFYNSTSNNPRLSCRFVGSRDLFNETTVANIALRFQHLFFQLFSKKFSAGQTDRSITSINKLSLILPEEVEEMQRTVFCRLPNIVSQGIVYL